MYEIEYKLLSILENGNLVNFRTIISIIRMTSSELKLQVQNGNNWRKTGIIGKNNVAEAL